MHDNKYLLVVTDYFTRWVEMLPMPDQEAMTVARLFVSDFVCRFGIPRQIVSDQGRQFESQLFQEMCKLLDVDKTRISAFHPQANGLVERLNRLLKTCLVNTFQPIKETGMIIFQY